MSLFRWSAVVVPASAALLGVSLSAQAPPPPATIERLGAAASIDVPASRVESVSRADESFAGDDSRRERHGAARLFSWSGTVDSDVFIVVRGRDVTTQGRDRDLPFRVRVSNGMPRSFGTLVVNVDEGRGTVGVIEQPTARNGYQAVIRIQDRRGGADRYLLTAYWQDDDWRDSEWDRPRESDRGRDGRNRDDSNRGRDGERDRDDWGGTSGYGGGYGSADRGALLWSGRVDAIAEIRIRGARVDYITRSGARLTDVQSDIRGAALPRRQVDVIIYRREGRGDIDVVQQPNARNDYTAVIRVNDRRGGAGFYDFAARW